MSSRLRAGLCLTTGSLSCQVVAVPKSSGKELSGERVVGVSPKDFPAFWFQWTAKENVKTRLSSNDSLIAPPWKCLQTQSPLWSWISAGSSALNSTYILQETLKMTASGLVPRRVGLQRQVGRKSERGRGCLTAACGVLFPTADGQPSSHRCWMS